MASAVLPSSNDPRSSGFITKFTRLPQISHRNPNTRRDVFSTNHQYLPSSTPPVNSVPAVPPNSSGYRYITFRLDSYTKIELKGLKKRLQLDLERVRILRQFVCSIPVCKPSYHAPELVVQTAPVVSHSGHKRMKPLPLPPVRDAKKQCGGRVTVAQRRKMMMRECSQILGKLMKHKNGWVFNKPVDAVAMKLYDYHNVISKPMDLGTIKSKLGKNEYDSPLAFASDVRLTFENAMVYNGKGSDVFVMAERLLLMFEGMFGSAYPEFVVNRSRTQNVGSLVDKPVMNAKVVVETETPVVSRKLGADFGKPMIRTANNKREMTAEEKSELAECFWNLQLGPEGTNQIMEIVKKGAGLEREGDEIELDLAVLDNETLWELHSFISWVHKKKAATTCNMIGSVQTNNCRETDAGEEDVDIGEEMQLTNFPSVVIEKDVVNGSSGDSSSDSDTSSSDSGSGTSYNEQEVNSTPKGVVP